MKILNVKDKEKTNKTASTVESQEESTDVNGTQPKVEEVKSGETTAVNAEDASADVLAEYRAEAEANYDKYLRAVAELENFKKRAIKERADLIKYAGEGLARDILEIVDQLQLALKHEGAGPVDDYLKGVKMVFDNFVTILSRHQIIGEDSIGKQFDPQKHEAMASVLMPDTEPGVVVEEFKKAYFFKDKLLRPGQVVVAVASCDQK